MIARYCPDNPELLNRPPDMAEPLRKQAEDFSADSLLYMVELVSSAQRRARGHLEGRIAMEMTLVKLAGLGKLRSIEELIQRLEALEGVPPRPAQSRPSPAPARPAGSKEKVSDSDVPYSDNSSGGSVWGGRGQPPAAPAVVTVPLAAEPEGKASLKAGTWKLDPPSPPKASPVTAGSAANAATVYWVPSHNSQPPGTTSLPSGMIEPTGKPGVAMPST